MDNFAETMTSSESSFTIDEESFSPRMLQTGLLVDKYYTPLLCILGAFGNSLSLLVFCMDKKYRRQSCSYYLSALAISDTGFLLNLFAVWLESVMGGVITFNLTCPLVMYLGQVTCFMSIYLTVAFSLERYIAINFPFSRPRICTRSKAKKVIAAVTTVALLVFSYAWVIAKVIEIPTQAPFTANQTYVMDKQNEFIESNANYSHEQLSPTLLSPTIEIYDVPQPHNNSSCDDSSSDQNAIRYMCTVPERFYRISEIANYLDSGITLIIPFLLIAFFNVSIARSMWKQKSQRQNILASLTPTSNPTMGLSTNSKPMETGTRTNQLNYGDNKGVTLILPSKIMRNGSVYNSERKDIHQENGNIFKGDASFSQGQKINENSHGSYQYQQPPTSEVRVTKTLLLVSTVFIVLNLPLHAIRCTQFVQTATGTPEGQDTLQALQPWANMLFNTNFAVNFLLYCVSGSNFRKSLRNIAARMFKGRKPNLSQHDESYSLRQE